SRSASAAVVSRTHSSMSAPAMKFSGFPEKKATARTAASCSNASNGASRSCLTTAESLLTVSFLKSETTTAIPSSTSSQVSAAPVHLDHPEPLPLDPRALERLGNGEDGRLEQLPPRVHRRDRVGADVGERGVAERARRRVAHHQNRGRPVGERRGVGGGDAAV